MYQYCENPDCEWDIYETAGTADELDVCPNCGHYTCGRCGSHFAPHRSRTDVCIYCGGTGRIDCTDRDRDVDFCANCGDRCCRYRELEEEYQQTLDEYRRGKPLR